MSKEQDPKNTKTEQEPENTEHEPQPSNELTSEELDQVAGGTKPTFSDLTITKPVDTSSPTLH